MINKVLQDRAENKCNRHDGCFSKTREYNSFMRESFQGDISKLNRKVKDMKSKIEEKDLEIQALQE
jgi:hypothetical protein